MYATLNDTKLYFDVDGAEEDVQNGEIHHKPVVFVIHGGPGGSHFSFKPHLDRLTEHAQLVYIDQRGCGYSEENNPETYTLENNVADIEALRQYLGLSKIWILGHSYGGMVAMSYAVKYQQHLHGLLLAATSPSYRFLDKAKKYIEANGNEEQKYYATKLWQGNFQSEEELQAYYDVMEPLYSVASQSASATGSKVKTKRSYQALNQGFGGFLRSFDVIEKLPNVHVPTLIIAAESDWITPTSENRVIHENMPQSAFHLLKNSSHSVFVDQRDECLTLIGDFLDDHR
ncbi:alpha/beta fold hydrolase [Virgibacillus sp. NKC19-3]|uniref:alpha/beta fold hydrolase n=1 Tax=Virgibacillus saliphilus TaxID=2831674 RepID=UPI001C9A8F35|nr:alpha/beta fold hydrolase [Virgibacillus sp. NKC19-3]MBY7144473.1 alpha/beta fold hydrolase [Virgibacillus sp. NKC19-3]